MPYTQEELARLMQPPDLSSSVEPLGVPFKTGKQLLNIAPRAGNSLLAGVVGAVGSVRPDLDLGDLQKEAGEAIPSFDVGPNTGIKDTILNDVAPEIASWMVPYLGASKVAKGLGLAGRAGAALTEGIGQGVANYISGSKESTEDAARTGALGFASGAVQMALPRWQRILPLAGIGAADMLAGGSLAEAGINLAGNMLPGAFNNVTKPALKVETPKVEPLQLRDRTIIPDFRDQPQGIPRLPAPHTDNFRPRLMDQSIVTDYRGNEQGVRSLPGAPIAPEGRTWNSLGDGPDNPMSAFEMVGANDPIIEGQFRKILDESPLALPEGSYAPQPKFSIPEINLSKDFKNTDKRLIDLETQKIGKIPSLGIEVPSLVAPTIASPKNLEIPKISLAPAKDFVTEVKEAVSLAPEDAFFGQKLYLNRLHEAWEAHTGKTMPLEEFKAKMLSEARQAKLGLSRLDFAPIDPVRGAEYARSLIPSEIRDGNETFNFLTTERGYSPRITEPVLADTKVDAFPVKPAEQLQLDHPKIVSPSVGPIKGSLQDLDEVAQGMKIFTENLKQDIKASQENLGEFTQKLVDETVGSVEIGNLDDPFTEAFAPYREAQRIADERIAAQKAAERAQRIAEGRPRPSDLLEPSETRFTLLASDKPKVPEPSVRVPKDFHSKVSPRLLLKDKPAEVIFHEAKVEFSALPAESLQQASHDVEHVVKNMPKTFDLAQHIASKAKDFAEFSSQIIQHLGGAAKEIVATLWKATKKALTVGLLAHVLAHSGVEISNAEKFAVGRIVQRMSHSDVEAVKITLTPKEVHIPKAAMEDATVPITFKGVAERLREPAVEVPLDKPIIVQPHDTSAVDKYKASALEKTPEGQKIRNSFGEIDQDPAYEKIHQSTLDKEASGQRLSPIEQAWKLYGNNEGKGHNPNKELQGIFDIFAPKISQDQFPWCASFVSYSMIKAGVKNFRSAYARDFLNFGKKVNLADAKQGDLCVLRSGDGNPNTGHVGFFIKKEGEFISLLAGNQEDGVNVKVFHESRVLGTRRAPNEPGILPPVRPPVSPSVGGKPKVPEVPTADAKGKGMLRGKKNQGAVDTQTMALLAVAGIAGVATYTETKGDVGATVAVSLAALGLGLAGAKAFNKLKIQAGPKVGPLPKTHIPNEPIIDKLRQYAKDTSRNAAGYATMGRGGLWANAVLMAEHLTGLNSSVLFRDAKIKADGYISYQLDVLSKAWDNVKAVTPTAGGAEASSRYLRGQLGGKVETDALLGAGGLDSAAYNKLDKAGKGHYPDKWIVMDDPKNTNTKGPGVAIYHVTNSTKKALLKLQDDAFDTLMTTPQDKEFMAFTKQSRQTIDNLMQVVHAALPPGKRLDTVIGTMGQYASRTHEIFSNPNYYPDDLAIQKAMDRIAIIKEGRFFDQAAASVSPSVGTVPITYGGNTYHITPAQKIEFDNLHTPESLRSLVTQYIKEAKQIGAAKGKGLISRDTETIGSSLFSSREELDAVTQTLLGTHTAPLHMIQQTVNKLVPSAKAAHFMQDLIVMPDHATGLPMAFRTEGEYNKAINRLKDEMTNSATLPSDLQRAKNQYQELSSYIPVSGHDPKMGLFQGSYVSRGAHTQLAGFNNPFGILDSAIGHGLSNFNNLIKETHLNMNPIVHVRNLIQIPMFLLMGAAGAHPAIWKTAFEALHNPTSAIGRKLIENGATVGNAVHGEFNHGLREMLNGTTDSKIWAAFKKGRKFSRDLYAFPDDFVRASTFLAAEERAAKKFGVAVIDNDPRVLQEARLFMSRRTMDYANVPAWVKAGRQVPMVSMFLSYTHEIMRVTANMGADAMRGDLHAGATLAGLSTIPFMLQSMAENQLSPTDLKAWNQAQKVGQDYSRSRFKLPLSRNKDGTFNYVDITPLSPINDFQMAARAISKGDTGALIANNPFVGLEKTPLLSIMSEQITGKETHTGKEFRDGWDRARSLAQAIVPPMTPGIGNEYKKTFPESMGGTLGITNVKTGRTNTGIGALLRNTLGVDYTQVNADIATKNFIKSAQHDIANEKQYLLDVERQQGISQEAKEHARERFVAAVKHISETLESRLK